MNGCRQGIVLAARSAAFMDLHGIFSFEHMVMLTNKWRFHQLLTPMVTTGDPPWWDIPLSSQYFVRDNVAAFEHCSTRNTLWLCQNSY